MSTPGRPRRTQPAAPKRLIGLKVPPAFYGRFEAIATSENNTVSAVVRRILSAGLEAEERRATDR
jgi:hypothetical protein